MSTTLYIAANEDISLYKGDYFDSITFTITNSDSSAYDFTVDGGVSSLDLKVFDRRGGTELASADQNSGLSQSSNVITLAYAWANFDASGNIKEGHYYYELSWTTTTTSKKITLTFGVLTVK